VREAVHDTTAPASYIEILGGDPSQAVQDAVNEAQAAYAAVGEAQAKAVQPGVTADAPEAGAAVPLR